MFNNININPNQPILKSLKFLPALNQTHLEKIRLKREA
jgi:hypothetical protein